MGDFTIKLQIWNMSTLGILFLYWAQFMLGDIEGQDCEAFNYMFCYSSTMGYFFARIWHTLHLY